MKSEEQLEKERQEKLLEETKTTYLDAHEYVAEQRKKEVLKAIEEQIKQTREKAAKESFVRKCFRILGKIVIGCIILLIVSPLLINMYRGFTGDEPYYPPQSGQQ